MDFTSVACVLYSKTVGLGTLALLFPKKFSNDQSSLVDLDTLYKTDINKINVTDLI